jgi:hypothetical protein
LRFIDIKLLDSNKNGKKGDRHKRLSAHFLFSYSQERIAQLQQEKEEILRGLDNNLTEEEEQQIMLPMHEMKVLVNSYPLTFQFEMDSKILVNFHWKIGSMCWHLCPAANWEILPPKLGTANSLESSNYSFMMNAAKSHLAEWR